MLDGHGEFLGRMRALAKSPDLDETLRSAAGVRYLEAGEDALRYVEDWRTAMERNEARREVTEMAWELNCVASVTEAASCGERREQALVISGRLATKRRSAFACGSKRRASCGMPWTRCPGSWMKRPPGPFRNAKAAKGRSVGSRAGQGMISWADETRSRVGRSRVRRKSRKPNGTSARALTSSHGRSEQAALECLSRAATQAAISCRETGNGIENSGGGVRCLVICAGLLRQALRAPRQQDSAPRNRASGEAP